MDNNRIYEACSGSRDVVEAKLPSGHRQRVNGDIRTALLNKFWDKPYHAINELEKALEKHGLTLEGSRSADVFLGDSGSRSLTVFQDGEELSNTALRVSWSKAGDRGKFDVTAYLS